MTRTKANKSGRNRQNEHFAMLTRALMEEPAFRALGSTAKALYPSLRLEWHGPNNNNNGRIQLSVRQAAERLCVTINTAAKAFHDLQAKGFIVVTKSAVLGLDGRAKCTEFELTELAMPGSGRHEGRKLYKQWQKGGDIEVIKVMANNPTGKNGRRQTGRKNEDGTVIEMRTASRNTSRK